MSTKFQAKERFAAMWRRAREDAGISQEDAARISGVTRKTIQRWEEGSACPSQVKGFDYLIKLGRPILPYYLEILYPELEGIKPSDPDEKINHALCAAMKDIPSAQKRKILYVLYGDHGSSPTAALELLVAHLQTPLHDRVSVAQTILTDYQIAEATGNLSGADHIHPNADLLERAIDEAKSSCMDGRTVYHAFDDWYD